MRSEAPAVAQPREDPAEAGLGERRRRGQNPAIVTGQHAHVINWTWEREKEEGGKERSSVWGYHRPQGK